MVVSFSKFIILFLEIGGIKIKKAYKKKTTTLAVCAALLFALLGWFFPSFRDDSVSLGVFSDTQSNNTTSLDPLPSFDGENYVVSINGSNPSFTETELSLEKKCWQTFSELDGLNRVGAANAMLHERMMPTKDRGDISTIKPSGWHQKKQKEGWLYDRSHLIGFQFTGENANWKNLFTGTRQMNQGAMKDYEMEVASYLKSTENHVRYRVTPRFLQDELVCRGIQIEAQSIEDDQIHFNIFIFNVADGVTIDYLTGRSTHN